MNWERSARASGAVFVVLAVAAFVIAGESPKVSDSAEEVVNYLDSNRNQLIVGSLLFAIGFVFFLWFAAAVANHLRERGEGRVAATVLVAGAAFAAVQFVVMALFATLAFSVAGAGDATLTKALYDLDVGLDNLDGLVGGLFVLAASVGLGEPPRSRPGSHGPVSSWRHCSSSERRPGRARASGRRRAITYSSRFCAASLWILVTSITLVRRAPSSSEAAERPLTTASSTDA